MSCNFFVTTHHGFFNEEMGRMIGEENDYFAGPADATTSSSLINCYECFYGCCYGRVKAYTKVSDRNVTIVQPGDKNSWAEPLCANESSK